MQIGGTIKRSDVGRFIDTALNNYAELDYSGGDADDFLDEIEDRAKSGKPFELTGNEVPWGHLWAVEALCQELGLAYYVRSDACEGVYGESIGFWEPGLDKEISYDGAAGDPVMNTRTVRALLRSGLLEAELTKMERIEAFNFPLVIAEDAAPEGWAYAETETPQ